MSHGRTRNSGSNALDDFLQEKELVNQSIAPPKNNGKQVSTPNALDDFLSQKKNGGDESNSVSQSTLPNTNGVQQSDTPTETAKDIFGFDKFAQKTPSITTPDGTQFNLTNPTPLGNSDEGIAALQQRVNDKIATPQDIQLLADASGKSLDATKAYVTQGAKMGASVENNDNVTKTQQQLINYINTYNQVNGTSYNPSDVLSSSDKLNDFLNTAKTKVINPQTPVNNNYAVSSSTRVAHNFQPLTTPLPSDVSNEMLNQVVQKTVSEDQAAGIPKDTTINKIYQKINPYDYKKVNAINTATPTPTSFANIFRDTKSEDELLNYQKGIAELKYNDALKQNAIDKISQGTVSGDNNLVQQGQTDLSQVDDNVVSKYPILQKQQIVQAVNNQIAKESGVVVGSDANSLNDYKEKILGASMFDRIRVMKQLGYLDNPNTKDVAESLIAQPQLFADNSIAGSVPASFAEPFKNLFGSIGDIAGIRDSKDIYSDKVRDELFQKDFSGNNENNPDAPQLKEGIKISRNILNTTANLAGMTAIASATEGLGTEAGLSTKAAQQLGAYTSFGLPSFDQSLKDSKSFIDSEPAQYLYAAINSIANAEGGRLLDLGKITRIPGVSDVFAKVANGLTDNSISKEVMQETLDKGKNAYINFAMKFGKSYTGNVTKIAATMAYFNIVNNVTKMAFGDPNQTTDKVLADAGHSFLDGVLGGSIMGAFGAAADMRNEKNTTFKGTIYNMALNHDSAADIFKIGLDNGTYTKPEYDQKMQILNTARAAKNSLDATSADTGIDLTQDQKSVYVANKTAQAVFVKKSEQDGIPEETKNKYLAQADRLGEQSTQILDGLKFTPTLEPLYNLFDAEKEYNAAKENYNPADKKSSDALETAKNNYYKLYTDYLAGNSDKSINIETPKQEPVKKVEPTEVSDTEIIPTFEKVKSFIPEQNLDETQTVITKINNAENINVNDLSKAEDNLYTALDKAPEAAHLIEPLILKIQNYPDEFKTKTETGTVTEKVPIEGTYAAKSKAPEIKAALEQAEGSNVTIQHPDGSAAKGKLSIKSGQYVVDVPDGGAQRVIGEKAITDRDLHLPDESEMDNPIQFDKDGNVQSVTFKTHKGDLVTIHDPEKALDFAIQIQADKVGTIPDAAFEKAYQEVKKEVQTEVPISSQSKTSQNENDKKSGSSSQAQEESGQEGNSGIGNQEVLNQKGAATVDETAPLLDQIKSHPNILDTEKGNDLQTFIDRAGENPNASELKFGAKINDQLLEKVPTEKLQENLDFLQKNTPDSQIIPTLKDIISERAKTPAPENKGIVEDLNVDEKKRLNDLAKKNFNKQPLTDTEHNEYVDLKKKQIEYQRQRELNDPLSKSYENTIIGTGKVHKGIGYVGEKYSVSVTEDGHLSILKRNEKTGRQETVHEGDYGNKENALKEFEKHKQPIIDEINAKYDSKIKELPDIKEQTQNKGIVDENKNVNLQNKTSQDASDIITGKKVFERFSPEEQRGFAEGGTNHVEASLLLAADEGTGGKDNATPEAQENRIEVDKAEKELNSYNEEQFINDKGITESDEFINHLIDQYESENSTKNIEPSTASKESSVEEISNPESGKSKVADTSVTEAANSGGVNEPPKENVSNEDAGNKVGVSHAALTDLAQKLGLKEPERGEYFAPEVYAERGRKLLKAGADPNEVDNPNNDLHDRISIARAHLEDLVKEADKVAREKGADSRDYQKALEQVDKYGNDVVKKLGTLAHRAFISLQGERDIDTDSFTAVKRSFEDLIGEKPSANQEKKIKELTETNQKLKQQTEDLEKKLIEETNKNISNEKANKKYSEKAKNLADKFRKLKSKPLKFKDENGNEIPVQIQGFTWNDLVELGAKAIEKTGEIADGVDAIIEKVKDTDWYKKLSANDKTSFAQKINDHYANSITETPEAKKIKSLEKQRDDLLEGKGTQRNGKTEYKFTDEEKTKVKDLEDEIYELKKNLGLVKGKVEKPLTEQEEAAKFNKEVETLQKRFLNKNDNKFTADESKDIWEFAKENYLDKGINYRDMIGQVSDDLGLSWRQVSDAITTSKVRRISDEMWKKQADYRRNQLATKRWVGDQDKSSAGKALRKVSGIFRGVSVFGHGGIFMGTHAGMTLMQPSTWHKTIPAFFRGWKFAYGNVGEYERAIEEFKNRPLYIPFQRAGLKNNPERLNGEEYQKSQKYLGKLGLAGERGFNAVKVLRQDLAEFHYNKLTEAEKEDPSSLESIAQLVNLATGATNLNIPEWVNELTFAGGMEAARWGKLTKSPVKATTTALKAIFAPDKATTQEKVFAKVWARRVGEQLATFTSLLAANAAIQYSLNPNNPTNLTNPNKPDFLKFKFGDMTLDPTSGMRGVGMFIYGLGKIPFEEQKQLHGDTRVVAAGKQTFGYGRGKLAPLYSTLADFYGGQDYSRNPLPFSTDKPAPGRHKLTWGEYAWEKAPLPIAEAANVTYQSAVNNGANKVTLNNYLNGIVSGAISGSTGFRVGEYNAEEANHSPFTDKDKKDPTFKYFIDKGLELPNTSLYSEKVNTIDEKGNNLSKTIAEYPKDIQDKYQTQHKADLKDELDLIKNQQYVFVKTVNNSDGTTEKRVSINFPASGNYETVDVDKLSKEELAQVLHIAQGQATKRAKQEVFSNQ